MQSYCGLRLAHVTGAGLGVWQTCRHAHLCHSRAARLVQGHALACLCQVAAPGKASRVQPVWGVGEGRGRVEVADSGGGGKREGGPVGGLARVGGGARIGHLVQSTLHGPFRAAPAISLAQLQVALLGEGIAAPVALLRCVPSSPWHWPSLLWSGANVQYDICQPKVTKRGKCPLAPRLPPAISSAG